LAIASSAARSSAVNSTTPLNRRVEQK
jgi:hypothetical protein